MSSEIAYPDRIGRIDVPHDEVSVATWRWARRSLPEYLFAHSVRSYCWGVAIAEHDGLAFDPGLLWSASLLHDLGLTRIPRNGLCFEVEGAEVARRFVRRAGMADERAERVGRAIVLHMQPGVTLDDGVESVLLDRATGVDVRGAGYDVIAPRVDEVVRAFPRGSFDRLFVAAIRREVARRGDCQSARLLDETGLVEWMARSPWN